MDRTVDTGSIPQEALDPREDRPPKTPNPPASSAWVVDMKSHRIVRRQCPAAIAGGER